ncbi:MAG: helix-turn-helix transcriptional regulator [Clostridia bacterium]|nr:helix-turn-helix transcriptional regulator [Clostridia bacterium]
MKKLTFLDYIALAEAEYKRLLEKYPELELLSKREMDVFSRLLTDKTQAQIAQELYISHSSVHFHCKNIYKKLKVNSRMQLLIRYKDF